MSDAEPEAYGPETDAAAPESGRAALRMKDLCERTGLQRQAIHFYIKEGLLPPGHKSSRNMAWYGEEHVARLMLIKRLQHERFLPLYAIKAVLDEQDGELSPDQQAFIRELKRHAWPALSGEARVERVALTALCQTHGVTEAEAEALDRMGLAPIVEVDGARFVGALDTWVYETLAELRAAGFTAEAGFSVDELSLYEEAISTLFEREKELLASRLTRFRADTAAVMVERVMPLVHRFLERYHEAKIRRFFSAWE